MSLKPTSLGVQLAALGPLKLVLENGTPTERGRTCNTLTLDAAAGTYTYTYWSRSLYYCYIHS